MPTIAGVTTPEFSLPENDTRQQNVTIGKAVDGTFKRLKYRTSDRTTTITLKKMSTAVKDSLGAALEADVDGSVSIAPSAHIDLGSGAGTTITAQWLDPVFDARKTSHEFWTVTLNFQRTA